MTRGVTDGVAIGKEANTGKTGRNLGVVTGAKKGKRRRLKQRNQSLAQGKVAGVLDGRVSGRNFLLRAVHQGVKEAAACFQGSGASSLVLEAVLCKVAHDRPWIGSCRPGCYKGPSGSLATTRQAKAPRFPDPSHVTQPHSRSPALARAFSEAHTKYSIRTHLRNITTSTFGNLDNTAKMPVRSDTPCADLWAISARDFDFRRLREIRPGPEEGSSRPDC